MMENNDEELLRRYEALWENDAPMEKIVDFCRQHLGLAVELKNENKQHVQVDSDQFFRALSKSTKWGSMIFMPSFLRYLHDDDNGLLCAFVGLLCNNNHFRILVNVSRILSMKRILSDKVRASFWGVLKAGFWQYCRAINIGCADITLVDNENMRQIILKRKIAGYDCIPKGLVFLDDKRFIALSDKMIQALQLDSVSLFEMALTLSGKNISMGLLRAILRANAFNVLIHLLKHRPKTLTSILSPLDLLICLCASEFKNENEIKVLETLEELYPGISKSMDKLGNTPLWYCLYHRNSSDFLVQELIRYGCNPDARNHLNLSYNLCKDFKKHELC